MLKVKEIISSTGGGLVKGNEKDFCKGVSIDSRTINQGEVFVAIEGENFNGHDFIPEALEKKAKGVIFSDYLNFDLKKFDSKFFVKVKNTVNSLGELAGYYREKYSPKVIGITGSVGKTTTKDFIYEILSSQYEVCKSIGTQNNQIGVPLNILKYAPVCDILVLELGTNMPGEIPYLSKICTPDVGVVLNVGPSHLKNFKTIGEVKKEKLSLLKYIKAQGWGVVNKDFFKQNIEKNFITFGIDKDTDYQATNIKFEDEKMKFKVNEKEFTVKFRNREYIYNLLAGIAVSSIFKIDEENLIQKISNLEVTSSRFQNKHLGHCIIFDDSYNSNPMSLRSSLKNVVKYSNPGRKLVVLGDMLELGDWSKKYHIEIGEFIAETEIDEMFLLGEMSQYIKEGSLRNGMKEEKVIHFSSLEQACKEIPDKIKKDDIILIKGSRAMNMEKIVNAIQEKY